jgi:hypothetical protein
MIGFESSGKDRLWSLFFLWPFIGVPLLFDSNESEYEIYIKLGLGAGWLIWFYFCRYAYKLIKEVLNKKKPK